MVSGIIIGEAIGGVVEGGVAEGQVRGAISRTVGGSVGGVIGRIIGGLVGCVIGRIVAGLVEVLVAGIVQADHVCTSAGGMAAGGMREGGLHIICLPDLGLHFWCCRCWCWYVSMQKVYLTLLKLHKISNYWACQIRHNWGQNTRYTFELKCTV